MQLSQREKNRLQNEKEFINFVANVSNYEIAEQNFTYINARQKVKMKHICCGTEWLVTISKFMNDGSRCPNVSCFTEKRVSHLRKSDKLFDKIKNNYEILDPNFYYTSKNQRILVKHNVCGHSFNPIIQNLVRDKTICPNCKTKNRKDRAHDKIISFINNIDEYTLLSSHSHIKSEDKITVKHDKCGAIFFPTTHNFKDNNSRCPRCSGAGTSRAEKQVVDWLKTVYTGEIIENSRSIISPKELDIYLPQKGCAIEYNGLYWHSGDKIDKKAHLNKTLSCKEKGIKLFHIFSDEWRDKEDIVKSMIKYRIGLVEHKIPARKCVIKVLDRKTGSQFFIDNHISGDNKAKLYVGLFFGDQLVACVSVKKPIQKKYGNVLEIARFANVLNTTVQGGFGKLFGYVKDYAKNLGYAGILTYADRRFGDGEVYLHSGFVYISSSPVDYWYSEGIERYFRFKYRAQKPLSEKAVAEQNGVYPVFGCGSNTYIYRF